MPWDDSDVFKVIEDAAYTLAQHPDAELDRYLDNLIAQIAGAQEPDGYLYTARTLGHKAKMMGPKPFSQNRDACELYNVGHLYEAAVAHYEVTGKRTLLDVAIKNADLVAKTFGLGKGQSREVPGHEEIEIGLCRLYQATGDAKYLKLAQHFIDMRGRKDLRPVWGAAYQDHKPVLEQKEALGHAVRAAYLYAGMADVAALTGNTAYVDAIDALWENVVGRKLHLNGGIGARRHVKYRDPALGSAHEAFGDEYDLQNLDAYLETCAAIGNGGRVLDACLPLNTTFTEGEIEIASTRMVSLTGGGLTLVPYFAWCHRGVGEMQTWFAASTEATEFCIHLKCRPKRSAGIVEIRTR